MKSCAYFKDLILTDYIDNQLDQVTTQAIEKHLFDCHDCRLLVDELKLNLQTPRQVTNILPVPEELWVAVRQSITEKSSVVSPMGHWIGQLNILTLLPRAVPALLSVSLVLLAGSLAFNTIRLQQAQAQAQGTYLVAMLASASALTPMDTAEQSGMIEKYFLS